MSKMVRIATGYRIYELEQALNTVFGNENVIKSGDLLIALTKDGDDMRFLRDSLQTYRALNPRVYQRFPQWRELGRIYAQNIRNTITRFVPIPPINVQVQTDNNDEFGSTPFIYHDRTPNNDNRSGIILEIESENHQLSIRGSDYHSSTRSNNRVIHKSIDLIKDFLTDSSSMKISRDSKFPTKTESKMEKNTLILVH